MMGTSGTESETLHNKRAQVSPRPDQSTIAKKSITKLPKKTVSRALVLVDK